MTQFFTVLAVLFIIIYATRALPFVFSDFVRKSRVIKILGPSLPLAIMTLLTAHGTMISAKFFPALLGVAITALTQLKFRLTILSIFLGTTSYILLIKYI